MAILCRTVHVMYEGESGKHYIAGPTDSLVALKKIDIWSASVTFRPTTSNFVYHLKLKGGINTEVNAIRSKSIGACSFKVTQSISKVIMRGI